MRGLGLVLFALASQAAPEPRPAGAPHPPIPDRPDGEVDGPEPPPLYVAELRPPGPLFGLDVGLGRLDAVCAGCAPEGGVALALYGGLGLGRRVALVLDASTVLHLIAEDRDGRNGLAGHSQLVAAARVWLAPRLWISLGAGAGLLHVHGPDRARDVGPAALAALGHEVKHTPTSGIDLVVRVGGTIVGSAGDRALLYNIAALAGFHWN